MAEPKRGSREATRAARRPTIQCGSQDLGATEPAALLSASTSLSRPSRCPRRLLTRHSVAVQVVPDGLLQLVVRRALLEALAEKVPQVLAQLSSCRKHVKQSTSTTGPLAEPFPRPSATAGSLQASLPRGEGKQGRNNEKTTSIWGSHFTSY